MLQIAFCLGLAYFSYKHYQGDKFKLMIKALVAFLILYFPILEYWSIWIPGISFWPEGFTPGSGSILSYTMIDYTVSKNVYWVLDFSSSIIRSYTFFFLIFLVNDQENLRTKVVNWIPLVNIFSIGLCLMKRAYLEWKNVLIPFWVISMFTWFYYNVLALPLAMIGFNSYSWIDQLLFGHGSDTVLNENTTDFMFTPTGYGFTYLMDLSQIITPVPYFLSGIMTLILVWNMRKSELGNEEFVGGIN